MKRTNRRKGQSLAEYGIIVGIVLAAVFAMGPYIKERIQGGIQFHADNYFTQTGAGAVYNANVTQDSESMGNVTLTTAYDGNVTTSGDTKSKTTSQ